MARTIGYTIAYGNQKYIQNSQFKYRTAPLRPTFRKKRGGCNNEDLRFRLAVKPPPLPSNKFAYSVVR